jgi:hypothetical protein
MTPRGTLLGPPERDGIIIARGTPRGIRARFSLPVQGCRRGRRIGTEYLIPMAPRVCSLDVGVRQGGGARLYTPGLQR